ncbi:hypothetical protein THAPSDRAFT_260919, partial [Thalassiosira pseudonana CCMP1335]
LILTRHGDSIWNGKETFTGWTDVPLSPIGEQEAIRTGQLLTQHTSGVVIDALFTSTLSRAKMTAHHYQVPRQYLIDHRLNERHYGALQGLVKSDAELGLFGHSPSEVLEWRRSWHAVPPLLDEEDPRRLEELRLYGNLCDGVQNVPRGESLAMVASERIRPFLKDRLTPLLDKGGTALIVAHANSLRALIGHDSAALRKLEAMKIPTASPLVL